MSNFSFKTYLKQNPLSEVERNNGKCLRLVRCTRATRYTLAYFFICVSKSKEPFRHELRPYGLLSVFIKNAEVYQSEVFEYEDELQAEWFVREYELVTPYLLPYLTVSCCGMKKRLKRSERKTALEQYWHSISHATRCKGYAKWAEENRKRRLALCNEDLSMKPLISVITPVYKTPPKLLEEMIYSVSAQTYKKWEHILINASPEDKNVNRILASLDDERVKILTLAQNEGIVGNTNAGIEAACGDYLCFLDHDDLIEEDALYWIAKTVDEKKGEVDLIYFDEDSIDERGIVQTPRLKPSLNLDLLYANNYLLHLLTVSRRVIERSKRSDKSVEGAQDYDLTLKAIENARNCVRIPEILYHWRSHRGSTNSNPDSKTYSDFAGQKSLIDHFDRIGARTEVHRRKQLFTYQSEFLLPDDSWPDITCLMEARELPVALRSAIDEYREAAPGKTPNVEVVYCEGKAPLEKFNALTGLRDSLVLFVSGNIKELSPRFLQILAGYFQRDEVGVVAPKVIRNDGLIDYAGIAVTPDGKLMRLNRFMFEGARTFLDRPTHPYDSLVVNAEYFMMRSADLNDYEFDLAYETMDYSIADFCVQQNQNDKLCVYTPFAQIRQADYKSALEFYEASDKTPDIALFTSRYSMFINESDPSHNPNFDPYSPYYLLRGYEAVLSDDLRGHLWYLTKRAWHILKNNGIKNVVKTVKRYLLKRQS